MVPKKKNRASASILPTILGFLALLFWSTAIAFSRSVTEHMGTLNTAFFNLLFSAILLMILQAFLDKKDYFRKISRLPLSYSLRGGTFMVVYMVTFYAAIGEAVSREAVIVAGIINYLWPGLIFLFAVLFLKHRASYFRLIVGILIAFGGTALALLEGNRLSVSLLSASVADNVFPYLLALVAAVSWGLYSNMARKYKVAEDTVSVPVFFMAAAGVILVILLSRGEVPELKLAGWEYVEFACLVIFPTALAYLFWNRAMRDGNKHLVTAFSYLVPLASTLVSGFYLDVAIGPGFWGAAVLVLAGAVLCKTAIKE